MRDDANRANTSDIAIVGMAIDVPGADTLDQYWANLRDGVESIRRLTEDELLAAGETPDRIRQKNYVPAAAVLEGFDTFDADFFGFSPKEAAILDPQHRKFLEVAWKAMENAGHPPHSDTGPVGVYAGCGMGSYFYFNICSNPALVNETGMFLLRHTGNDKDFLSTRVSHVFDLKGPSINLQTACSTSLVAVHYACQALRRGEIDMALAGGVTIELPQGRGYLFQENEILSPDGHCHAFDHRAQGTVFGSGAGAVTLKRLDDAVADGDHIWAVIKGSAVNNDGAAKAGYLAPSVDGQVAAIRAALGDAGVSAATLDYVECHGTGTYLGDPIEVSALTEAWRKDTNATDFARIGSVKTNIGHLDTAAGVAGLIKTALALHHAQIPPSLGYEAPNPAIDFDTSPFRVNDSLRDWTTANGPRRAAVNALGVGGTNAHAILEQAPDRTASDEADFPFQILTISGRSRAALDTNTRALAAHLRAHPEQPLADVAFTLKTGRHGFDKRRTLVAHSHAEAADLLESADPRRVFTHDRIAGTPEAVFMFPGGGAQYPDMARDLYETEPVFADWMDRGLDHLAPQLEYDLRALWLPEPGARDAAAETLKKPSVQLPLIMIVEYALAQLWMSWGVKPAALVGHSMGENTAACLAGVMTFEDCIDLVLLRGRLFDTVAPGGMLSVALPLAELEPLLGDDLDVASLNAPALTAVTGPNAALEILAETLRARDIDHQRIAIDIAAHSRMLDPILPEYRKFLASITLSAPSLPVLSNRTGQPLRADQATDPDYWVGQLRNTVLFADCIATLATVRSRVYLEVGPGKALSSLAQMCDAVTPGQVLASLRHPDQQIADDAYFFGVIGRLWACGYDADWSQVWGEARRNRVVLPDYQFQRSRYFIEPGAVTAPVESTALPVRADDIADWGYRTLWRPRLADLDTDIDEALETPRTWLIFTDTSGIGAALAKRLRDAGHTVNTVASGDTFTRRGVGDYTLAPERGRDGYESLLRDLADRDLLPDRIVHLWLVTDGESFRPGSSFFDRNQEHGFYSLMFLAQALSDHDLSDLHITAITSGAAQIDGEPLPHPEKATIAGPLGVIPRELPGLTCSALDIPVARATGLLGRFSKASDDRAPLIDQMLEDLLAPPANTVAALRDGRRFAQTIRPVALPDSGENPFRDGGTYLITGGFGGIALSVAEDLIRRHRANIVLVSRTALPEPQDRTRWIETHAPQDRTSRAIRAVQRLEEMGAQVLCAAADVCDVGAMGAAADAARARFGAITGVIHAAGTVDDAPLLGKTVLETEAVFAPKINGLRVLDTVFPDGALELLVLSSSTSTSIRAAGQIDYVAANEYLNAVARSRRGAKTRIVAVNWGVWADVGMAADATVRDVDLPEPVATDQPLLHKAGFDAEGRRIFTSRLRASDTWVLDQHRTRAGDALLPGTGYIELAAEARAAHGKTGPFEIRDLSFFRALDVAETPREIMVRLEDTDDGILFETRSDVQVDGRRGHVLNAQATLADLEETPGTLDLAAIRARCPDVVEPGADRLRSPQEAQLDFGPRWHVLRAMATGDGEGIAHLSLPEDLHGDLADGFLAHPGLMDLATGWAVALAPGYSDQHLWVPVSYRSVRLFGPVPATLHSWMRLSPGDGMDGFATFDVTLTDDTDTIVAEIEEFSMKRLATAAAFAKSAPVDAREVIFADAQQKPLSAAEEDLAAIVQQGIRAAEGPAALRRALSVAMDRDLAQISVSSLDLPALVRRADHATPQASDDAQTFERPQLDSAYVAPRNAIEEALAASWQSLLGVSQVGVDDSFFDLGGHSLIAVRLFAQIRKTWDVQFPISLLFEAPTIAAVAEKIAERVGHVTGGAEDAGTTAAAADRQRFHHLVALHQGDGGARTPLFIVAGMRGNVMNLRHLGLGLGTERPVYGVQAKGLVGDEEPHTTIEEAARAYIDEIRQVQPEGPYLLSGFSGGGITAYEIAQQLDAAGEAVAMIALLDTPLPVRPVLNTTDKALIKKEEFRRKGIGYLKEWAQARIAWELQKIRQKSAPDPVVVESEFNSMKIELAFRDAVGRYELRPWDGPLTLFRPPLDRHWQVSDGNWVTRAREYAWHDNQWTPWAPAIEVVEVPGDHDSMVLVPNVSVLTARLRTAIRAAERASRPARVPRAAAAE
ncbi:type I polyketide synthase [Oceaniglobus indicus]|uniref:type I polyketide synthase n=1 Tax=Oceaniglobus indicus TaxID=2047749 RepID=UPI000C19C5B7|nr:type I polyketide synthase [Oceaniglobus indicus]